MSDILQNIQWFPGHMTKTLRLMEGEIKNVDIVLEILDARIPYSSKNPSFNLILGNKPRLILLNKSDLADNKTTARWIEYYISLGYEAMAINSKEKATKRRVIDTVNRISSDVFKKRIEKGMTGLKSRSMVVGIPNVGKSTFINLMSDSPVTRVEDRPGVTRGKQWVVTSDIELLDMPGVLWSKFTSKKIAYNLAFCGAIPDRIVDIVDLAVSLLNEIKDAHSQSIVERFGISIDGQNGYELLEAIGRRRGMLLSKGEIDIERAAVMLLDELRGRKLGPISFENVEDIEVVSIDK